MEHFVAAANRRKGQFSTLITRRGRFSRAKHNDP
jgi:hypothetical protein